MDDRAIIALFKARNEQALEKCREKYGPYLRAVASNITGSARDAEECESDAYMAAWTKIPPEEPRSLRAWLARAARNHALALLERSAAQKRGCGEAEAVLDELAECVPAPAAWTRIWTLRNWQGQSTASCAHRTPGRGAYSCSAVLNAPLCRT